MHDYPVARTNVHRVGETAVRDSTPLRAVGARTIVVVPAAGRLDLYLNKRGGRSTWIVRVKVAVKRAKHP